MSIRSPFPILASLCIAITPFLSGTASARSRADVHECVTFARTWDAAVEEARLLNMPIVVHNHGFFCPPCWGMHSALLQNGKYMKFADEHTVEVIVLGSLDQGIAQGDPRAEEYEGERDGQPMKFMVEFPGMTREEMLALGRSKAASYNQTGGVPYTCVVDPHTLESLKAWKGGGHGAKSIMEEIETLHDTLREAHPESIGRKDLRKYEEAESKARAQAADGDLARALSTLEMATRKADAWPAPLRERAAATRDALVRIASDAVDALEALGASDPKAARRKLQLARSKVRGTPLEARVAALIESLAAR